MPQKQLLNAGSQKKLVILDYDANVQKKPANAQVAGWIRNLLPASTFEIIRAKDVFEREGREFRFQMLKETIKAEAKASGMETMLINLNVRPGPCNHMGSKKEVTGSVSYGFSSEEGWIFYKGISRQLGLDLPSIMHGFRFGPYKLQCPSDCNVPGTHSISVRIDYPAAYRTNSIEALGKKIGKGIADAILRLFPVAQAAVDKISGLGINKKKRSFGILSNPGSKNEL